MRNKKTEHTITEMVAEELDSISKIKDISQTIHKFNKLQYKAPKEYKPRDIVRLRKRLKISQAVFAYVVNARLSTVQKWEQGVNHPNGVSNRLLQLIDKRGLEVLQTN